MLERFVCVCACCLCLAFVSTPSYAHDRNRRQILGRKKYIQDRHLLSRLVSNFVLNHYILKLSLQCWPLWVGTMTSSVIKTNKGKAQGFGLSPFHFTSYTKDQARHNHLPQILKGHSHPSSAKILHINFKVRKERKKNHFLLTQSLNRQQAAVIAIFIHKCNQGHMFLVLYRFGGLLLNTLNWKFFFAS